MKFSNEFYDWLKRLALVWLPAIGTLYYALAGVLGFVNPQNVVGTIMAIDTVLGIVLHISSKTYTPPSDGREVSGQIVIDKSDPVKDTYSIELEAALEDIDKMGHILLKVVPKGGTV